MKNVFLCCCNSYITQVMHNDVIDHIGFDLNNFLANGYAVIDEDAVVDYFQNLEFFDISNDDCDDTYIVDYDDSYILGVLEQIISSLSGIEVNVESMRDGLYIWDRCRFDINEVIQMVA